MSGELVFAVAIVAVVAMVAIVFGKSFRAEVTPNSAKIGTDPPVDHDQG